MNLGFFIIIIWNYHHHLAPSSFFHLFIWVAFSLFGIIIITSPFFSLFGIIIGLVAISKKKLESVKFTKKKIKNKKLHLPKYKPIHI